MKKVRVFNRSNFIYNTLQTEKSSRLAGSVVVEGSKIASIPILCASLLTQENVVIHNLPMMMDQSIILENLKAWGSEIEIEENSVKILNKETSLRDQVDLNLVHGTLYFIPSLLMRLRKISFPVSFGGCDIGTRPINHIFQIMKLFGAEINEDTEKGIVNAELKNDPQAITLDFNALYGTKNNKYVSGATKTALIMSVLAKGTTIIKGAYWRRPIKDLCDFLNCIGADIHADLKNREIIVHGVEKLHGGTFTIGCDRIVVGTIISALAILKGEIELLNASLSELDEELKIYKEMGITLKDNNSKHSILASCINNKPVKIDTEEIDTDIAPMLIASCVTAKGTSYITESVWENRFLYIKEMEKFGAKYSVINDNSVSIHGGIPLHPAEVVSPDLRGAAALSLLALSIDGSCKINNAQHLHRGYVDFVKTLNSINANIRWV
ncbi:UDP-N-acetylglucosamine 1-carboxyvinyltransferase [Treponema bryantii]|uniref:UDP-N-acetylglucosamine 1-carboxyvinyltransferase n=1 Tax=Treponema bryantii TaxID=163 RepID=A0A1H9C4L6_9SPIR|nr:hypothetical protein [Treponema bryantii]SEP95763.1 UDP-N-acetylglucosamine 1-carboxyvinyltransferase [Treponema bryantii]